MFSFLIISIFMVTSSASNDKSDPAILTTNQFHLVPNSSFFQFRISTVEFDNYDSMSKVNGTITFNISNKNIASVLFNLIVFPPKANIISSTNLYNCYMREAIEDLQINQCKINNSILVNGSCEDCLQNAIFSETITVCMACNQSGDNKQVFSAFIFSKFGNMPPSDQSIQTPNSSLLIIVDNSHALTKTGTSIEMYLGYSVTLKPSKNDEQIIIMFIIILLVVITITIGFAVILTLKINKVRIKIEKNGRSE